MFTIEDTSRSLTVHRENRGYAICSQAEGSEWHRIGLTFDDARTHCDRLNRIAVELMQATPEQIFGLYYASHFLAEDIAANGVPSLI